jgi:phosphoribosylformylglycinamidine synthase
MDLKEPGNRLYIVGITKNEMGGSHFNLVSGVEGGVPPQVDLAWAPRIFAKLHEAITRGLLRSCHDLSEGGLAVAVAEMAFAGGVGADLTANGVIAESLPDEVLLFAESTTRFVVEVTPANAQAFEECLGDAAPWTFLGQTVKEPRLRIAGDSGEWVVWAALDELKEAWQKPLRW